MNPGLFFELPPLAILCTICTFGVFSQNFHDTLIQRIGLSLVASGSALQITATFYASATSAPCQLMVYGGAIYALGTLIKLVMQGHRRDQTHG